MLRRRAARVVVTDRRGRVLLFRGNDPARPGAGSWWFTPGGGAEAGETLADAAVREVAEETALDVTGRLLGPVWERDVVFGFEGREIHQHEQFFLAPLDLDGDDVAPDRAGWTAEELRSVDDQRWWTPAELAATSETVHPTGLAQLLPGWLTGVRPAPLR